MTPSLLLHADTITKFFPPATHALKGVSLEVRPGEVHALLGANGAGKSTLLKVISGAHAPDTGQVTLDGTPVHFRSPHEATRAGIAMIYQELDLVPELTVAENLFLGHEPARLQLVRHQERRRLTQIALDKVGATFSPAARVQDLSLANQQLAAIARALTQDARLIIMDEPSAALNEDELDAVFAVIRDFVAGGGAVLYVSHRLKEVMEIADRATVLRDGQNASVFNVPDIAESDLVNAMVGEHHGFLERHERAAAGGQDNVLHIRSLRGPEGLRVDGMDVAAGEIVGVTGVNGSGRTTLMKSLFGEFTFEGQVELSGEPYRPACPRQAIASGVGLVPENRKTEGLLLGASLVTNATLPLLRRRRFSHERMGGRDVETMLSDLGTRFASILQPAGHLSGGNQQKVVVSKWLMDRSKLLLLDEPSRGLDVKAKEDLYALIRGLAEQGNAVLVASSELDELYANCDRIWVLHEGANVGPFTPNVDTREAILSATIVGHEHSGVSHADTEVTA
jgi:ribose transport system ATP-binding protein